MRTIITTFFFFFFFLTASISFAQSTYFTMEETQPFRDIKNSSDLLAVHQFENREIVIVRQLKKKLVVSFFNAAHEMKNNLELDKEKKETFVGSVITDDVVRIFTSNKVDKKNIEIYCSTYIPSSNKVEKIKLYSNFTGKRKGSSFFSTYWSLDRKYNENFRVSPNGEYLAFAIDNVISTAITSLIRVYDKDLNEVYNRSFVDDTDSFYRFDDFVVTNDAIVITAGKSYKEGRRDKKNGKANYDYTIHKVTQNESSYSHIDLGENFIQEVRFAQTEDAIRVLGFYSEKKSSRMKGGISFVFEGTNILNINPKTTPFPAAVYDDIYREAKAERRKKKEKEFRNYYLDYSLVDENGNAYLLAEQFYVTQQTTGGGVNGLNTTITLFHYDNILAIKFDSDENLVWGRNILKSATEPSYNALEMDGKLHVLLNTGKNIQDKSDGRKKVKKSFFEKSALYDIVFDEDGEQTFQLIKENDGRKDFYSPRRGNFDYDNFIMANLSKNKRQFLILSKK